MFFDALLAVVVVASVIACIYYYLPTPAKEAAPMASAAPATRAAPIDLKVADLAPHDGNTPGLDLWMGADGFVFNVEAGRDFYGPGNSYAPFCGRDATIGLATMEVDPSKWTKHVVSDLSSPEVDTLGSWVSRFRQKYPIVGFLNDGARPMTVAEARERGYVQ